MSMNWDSPNVRLCMHEDAERYGGGDYCVYFWEDDANQVFYVGSGKNYRFSARESRSNAFKRWENNKPCRPRIVAYGMEKEESLDFEKRLITAFWELDFPLVNVIGIPEREKKISEKKREAMLWLWHGSQSEEF